MEPTKELIAALEREKLESAMRMSPAQKLLAGPELFDYACSITMAGIRSQNPSADEAQVLDILRERLRWARRREELE